MNNRIQKATHSERAYGRELTAEEISFVAGAGTASVAGRLGSVPSRGLTASVPSRGLTASLPS